MIIKLTRVRIWVMLAYLAVFHVGQAAALERPSVTLFLASPSKKEVVILLHPASDTEEKFVRENFFEDYDRYMRELNPEITAAIAPPVIYLAAISLNKSKEPAYIVVTKSIVTCGTIGCRLDVWKKQNKSWIKMATGSNIKPLNLPGISTVSQN